MHGPARHKLAEVRMIRFAAALLIVVLSACSGKNLPPPHSTLRFDGTPIRLDVARIDVVTEYTSPLAKPNIEHLMPIPPAMAAKRWAEERLRPEGGQRVAKLVIIEGSVVEVPLKKTEGVRGFFTVDQEARYDAKLSVRLDILDDRAFRVGTANAESVRSRSLSEKATLNEREQLYYDLTAELMRDIDAVMDKQIADNLSRLVVR
jgi:hypothetical protein